MEEVLKERSHRLIPNKNKQRDHRMVERKPNRDETDGRDVK